MATIADVARRAGVATSTVSHVLNRTRVVSPETTRAVEDAVAAVGYTPNVLARALARSVTNTVGLAISTSRNRFFGDIANAVEGECAKLGMMVLLANTRDDPDEELRVVEELHRRRVDGIILTPSAGPDAAALAYLRDNAIPAVLLDRLPDAGFDGIGVENTASMAALVDELADRGHSRIGLVAGQAGFTTTRERVAGAAAALRRRGLGVDPALVSDGHVAVATARAATARMLALTAPPTALIGGNNLATVGILAALRDAGLAVPRDMAVVGFDDFEWSDSFEPGLTVLAQPCDEIGRRAAAMLRARIAKAAGAPALHRVAPTLIRRSSSGGA
ncbi:LacI family transcriptional regulator [Lichenibacterium minor]|uniref:LacI family transcriptional regulator n=1 Tax=Lichenibacterium minor TaxID=2316528 RepID=A0A4Q2U9T7_9HYPH|nr:LacI family DNA-binding transcriptional regulator [Lichenibacterium minor]RYC33320.1 LacI family transcriptional regulator [Lichenibacterium minor]